MKYQILIIDNDEVIDRYDSDNKQHVIAMYKSLQRSNNQYKIEIFEDLFYTRDNDILKEMEIEWNSTKLKS
jgi:hypothetical protein